MSGMSWKRNIYVYLLVTGVLANVVGVAVVLYEIKSGLDINLRQGAGWHNFRYCVQRQLLGM